MRTLLGNLKSFLVVLLVVMTVAFALYTGGMGSFQAPLQRGIFLLLMLPLIFFFVPSGLFKNQIYEDISSMLLASITVGVFAWNSIHIDRLYSDPFLAPLDLWLGIIGLLLVLEAVRRTVGLAITSLFVGALFYAYYGQSIPFRQLRHAGLDVETIVNMIFYGTNGVFGTPVGVAATFIMLIIIFGSLLAATGGATMFMNLASGLAGRFTGGPAKIAVVGSVFMGMITGATVANVATTGSVTIPMMKRAGYDRHFAGAVEALASSGGQLMPPIMGAAAFVMMDYLNLGYFELVGYAIAPALLYFFSVLMVVHVRSLKFGFGPVDTSELPSIWEELKKRGHMLLPIILLVVLMTQRLSIMYVAFFAVIATIVLSLLRSETRLDIRGFYSAFETSMQALAPLVAITAGAGILIGVLTSTGMNLKITFLIEYLAQGSLFLTLILTMFACIILGMGLPTVAAYVVLATLVPASLINLGISPIAAHLFIFYFAIVSAITPPVCTGAYVAASISGGDPIKTGFVAIKLGMLVFLLPFAFVYSPTLLMIGTPGMVAFSIVSTIVGIVYWAFGLEGYFRRLMKPMARVTLVASGIMLIWPASPMITLFGLALGGLVLFLEHIMVRRSLTDGANSAGSVPD